MIHANFKHSPLKTNVSETGDSAAISILYAVVMYS